MSSLNPLHVQKPVSVSQVDQRRSCQSKPAQQSHLDLLREGVFSDVTFIVGPSKERIPCHQIFLKARSPVFEVMFSDRWNHDKEVPLEDVDPKIFKKFLEYIYVDTFVANVSEALELLEVAHKYDVPLLVDKCEQLMGEKVTPEVAVDVFQAARKYEKTQVMSKVGDIMAKSLSKLKSHSSFSRVDKQTLMYILKRSDLKMKEVDIFRLAMQWAQNQAGLTMEQSLEDILPLIRFPLMTLEEFTAVVVSTELLSLSSLVEVFIYFGADAQKKKSMASTMKFSTLQRAVDDGPDKVDPGPSVSVPIYSAEFFNSQTTRREFAQLKECIEFEISGVVSCKMSSLNAERATLLDFQPEQRSVTLSSISFYCPPTIAIAGPSGETPFTSTKEFNVIVQTKSSNENYKEVLALSAFKTPGGKMTEVELDPQIPVETGMRFCIIVEEVAREMSGLEHVQRAVGTMCEAREFGPIQHQVCSNVRDKRVFFRNIRRNQLRGFEKFDGYTKPRLIFTLGLK